MHMHTHQGKCSYTHTHTEYIKRYATEKALRGQDEESSSSASDMSDLSEDEIQDMEL